MKVVCLVSGGKDSFFSMLECVRLGHEIVAIANLHPLEQHDSDELDSFTFQTVGHTVIPAYAECLGVPLFRRETAGRSVNQSLAYEPTEEDEVEDMLKLLQDVKEAHPEVQAVSSGAVLSNYQRTRVECVCSRLGLTSLAYMWQRSQLELLKEMAEANIESVVIKIASMGLKPTHLGRTVNELAPFFEGLQTKFGFHPAGEGGEYETLCLDCPLFSKRLVLDKTSVVQVSECDYSPVAYLSIDAWHLEPKPECEAVEPEPHPSSIAARQEPQALVCKESQNTDVAFELTSGGFYSVAGLTAAATTVNGGDELTHCGELDAGVQMAAVMNKLGAVLESHQLGFSSVVYCRLYVSQMAHFGLVNAEYCKRFSVNPPSRLCVALPLPRGVWVELECFGIRPEATSKETLHVQSVSRWAPTCIGPYSQATALHLEEGRVVHLAGQIGQHPPTMTLIDSSTNTQAAQCVANITAVLAVMLPEQPTVSLATTIFLDASCDVLGCSQYVNSQLADRAIGSSLSVVCPYLPRGASVEVGVCASIEGEVQRRANSECCFNQREAWCRAVGSASEVLSVMEDALACLDECEGFDRGMVGSRRVYLAPVADCGEGVRFAPVDGVHVCTLGLLWGDRPVEVVVELHAIRLG
eukprot:TRINITY_DN13253_c0_g1_i1.p1 TRINITY_DN13253_c0_g1~~TRINITY_DN13253_c0_g1_i1.p1  ORF type:complete len:639 (-),score=122.26 TRINITY_DN13253_c0_g1_i1:171-2087(-)